MHACTHACMHVRSHTRMHVCMHTQETEKHAQKTHTYSLAIRRWIKSFEIRLGVKQLLRKLIVDLHGQTKRKILTSFIRRLAKKCLTVEHKKNINE